MSDAEKTKEQLINELAELRLYVADRELIEKELIDNKHNLEEAQRIAKIGNWEWDIPNNTFIWSKELYSIFGVDLKTYTPTPEGFVYLVHPDDAQYVLSPKTYEDNNSAGKFEMEYRIIDQTTKQTKYVNRPF